MISDTLDTADKLQTALLLAEVFISSLEKSTLSDVLQAPDPINMEKFFSRVPSVFNIVIFSIHGYFGQEKVLGLPDTGGQVQ